MDPKSKEIFDELVVKEPHELNEEQVAFLRARRSYLNADQKVKFASLLKDADNAPATSDGLEEMSVEELKAVAVEKGIDVKKLDAKAKLLKAIRKVGK